MSRPVGGKGHVVLGKENKRMRKIFPNLRGQVLEEKVKELHDACFFATFWNISSNPKSSKNTEHRKKMKCLEINK